MEDLYLPSSRIVKGSCCVSDVNFSPVCNDSFVLRIFGVPCPECLTCGIVYINHVHYSPQSLSQFSVNFLSFLPVL